MKKYIKKFKKGFNFLLVLTQLYYLKTTKKINKKHISKKSDFPVLYINLKRSKYRDLVISKDLKKNFSTTFRVNAVDGKDFIEGENYYTNKIKSFSYDFSDFDGTYGKSTVACLLSHLIAVKKIHQMNFKYALVLEDDANLKYVNDWGVSLEKIAENAPDDFDIIKLHSRRNLQNLKLLNKNILYRELDNPPYEEVSSMALLWSRKGINKTLEFMKDNKFTFKAKHSEKIACDYLLWKINKTYDFTQPLIYGNAFKSLIGHEKPHRYQKIIIEKLYNTK